MLTRHRAWLTPWPYKAGAFSPLWPADTQSFDLPLYGDDRQAGAGRAAAVNNELMEQMLFLSKYVGIKCANSVHIKCEKLIRIVGEER